MKLAIPVNEDSNDTSICISFGRTPYFCIYDTDTDCVSYMDNSGAASQGGAGIKAAQNLVDSKISVLITPRCGENAASVLNEADVKIYKTLDDSVSNNLDAFKKGTLNLLDEIHSGFHNHGGK